ncbi:hypothetical protein E2562_000320 [Oryza meyeriana var. granulata]|uniref:Uncharacterized protein n=1 Tax=Oryza meyeriana var. granulata TaxID=110450 RepID=A0A6G1CMS0_9ORYZ|nr:hypothetical protein E2562_000320 [Oryza meyeriana var. granulata]
MLPFCYRNVNRWLLSLVIHLLRIMMLKECSKNENLLAPLHGGLYAAPSRNLPKTAAAAQRWKKTPDGREDRI